MPNRKYPITNNDYNWVVFNTLTNGKIAELVEEQRSKRY